MNMVDDFTIDVALSKTPLPKGARLYRNGRYLAVENAAGHPIAGERGRIPFHRFVLFESMGRPSHSACHWCGYVMPWKADVGGYQWTVVCADHLDNESSNNAPENLVPSCAWCNANRTWAELHPEFWSNWRRWLADVPPVHRPNLMKIAGDFGISIDVNGQQTNNRHLNRHVTQQTYRQGAIHSMAPSVG